jgi:hypothetical protein
VIHLIPYLAIAAGLAASLVSLALRKRVEGGSDAMVKAKHALSTLQTGLLPAELMGRLTDRADLAFVEAQGSEEIRDLFLAERKQVVLSWIGRVRGQIKDLQEFHLGSARFYAGLSLATEIGLAVDFMKLRAACRMLQMSVLVGGPYAAPRMVQAMAATATRVCDVSERSLAFLTPAFAVPAAEQALIRPVR